ncbi:MAG: hypothetical protein AAF609_05980 [Cyanobacteria bacterium P01_C01_bin.120]
MTRDRNRSIVLRLCTVTAQGAIAPKFPDKIAAFLSDLQSFTA